MEDPVSPRNWVSAEVRWVRAVRGSSGIGAVVVVVVVVVGDGLEILGFDFISLMDFTCLIGFSGVCGWLAYSSRWRYAQGGLRVVKEMGPLERMAASLLLLLLSLLLSMDLRFDILSWIVRDDTRLYR